jgi:hypothetical protein
MAYKHTLFVGITEKGEAEITGPLDDLELCMLLLSDALRVIVNRKRAKSEPLVTIPRGIPSGSLRIPGNGRRG